MQQKSPQLRQPYVVTVATGWFNHLFLKLFHAELKSWQGSCYYHLITARMPCLQPVLNISLHEMPEMYNKTIIHIHWSMHIQSTADTLFQASNRNISMTGASKSNKKRTINDLVLISHHNIVEYDSIEVEYGVGVNVTVDNHVTVSVDDVRR